MSVDIAFRSAVGKLAGAKRSYRRNGGVPVVITLGIGKSIVYDEAYDENNVMSPRYTSNGIVISYSDALDMIKERV